MDKERPRTHKTGPRYTSRNEQVNPEDQAYTGEGGARGLGLPAGAATARRVSGTAAKPSHRRDWAGSNPAAPTMKGREDLSRFNAAPGAPEDFEIRFTGLESSMTTCAACRSSVTERTGKKMTRAQARESIRRNEYQPARVQLPFPRPTTQKLAMASSSHRRLRPSSIETNILSSRPHPRQAGSNSTGPYQVPRRGTISLAVGETHG